MYRRHFLSQDVQKIIKLQSHKVPADIYAVQRCGVGFSGWAAAFQLLRQCRRVICTEKVTPEVDVFHKSLLQGQIGFHGAAAVYPAALMDSTI